jgi:uncharacterized protein (DUF302 family)
MRSLIGLLCATLVACGGSNTDGSTTPARPAPSAKPAPVPAKKDPQLAMAHPELDPGLTTVPSRHSFADTVSRLQAAIKSKGLTVFATIDHSANAQKAGLSLEPTAVIIFGKPQVGTQLMKAKRTVAIDLPQKMLVWQDGAQVKITYNDPYYLMTRHDLSAKKALLQKVRGLLEKLANGVGQSN